MGKVCGAAPVGVKKKWGDRVGCGGVDGGGGGTSLFLCECVLLIRSNISVTICCA